MLTLSRLTAGRTSTTDFRIAWTSIFAPERSTSAEYLTHRGRSQGRLRLDARVTCRPVGILRLILFDMIRHDEGALLDETRDLFFRYFDCRSRFRSPDSATTLWRPSLRH